MEPFWVGQEGRWLEACQPLGEGAVAVPVVKEEARVEVRKKDWKVPVVMEEALVEVREKDWKVPVLAGNRLARAMQQDDEEDPQWDSPCPQRHSPCP